MAGCAAGPDSAVPGGSVPSTSEGSDFELDAAWLDQGRMVGVVTWGSSTCIPQATDVTADGQSVSVTLEDVVGDQICTADYAPRASVVTLPAGVDPTQDVEVAVVFDSVTGDTVLEGNASLTGTPGDSTDYQPTAGWFDDGQLVLLTWGSSTCPPVVESAAVSGDVGTVTFAAQDGPCTMDMAPRATVLGFAEVGEVTDNFTLTLVGDDLDATLPVARG